MQRTFTLSAAGLVAAALLTGCSGSATPATTAAAGGGTAAPTASAGVTTSSTTTPTATAVTTTDAKTLLKQMMSGQKALKYYTSTTETSGTYSTIKSSSKTVSLVDNTNPDKQKMQNTTDSTMTMSSGGTPTTRRTVTIFDGNVMYMKEADGGWSKDDLSRYSTPTPDAAATPDEAKQEAAIDKLVEMIKEPKLIGEEQVNGTPTKHYQFRADLSQIFAGLSTASPSKPATASADDMATYDYWLDGNGVPVKSSSKTSTGTTTTVLSKINEPVTIQIPTNATVKPMPTYAIPTKK